MNKIEYNNILNNDVSLVERALIQNLPKAKVKSFGLISSAEEISNQSSVACVLCR